MTERPPAPDLDVVARRAAEELASSLGLGDEVVPTDEWPVGDGDACLVTDLVGELEGAIVLAVNTDVASRLVASGGDLEAAIRAATTAIAEVAGGQAEPSATRLDDAAAPAVVMAIVDSGTVTALVGLTLTGFEAGDDAAGVGSADTEQFVPATFDPVDALPETNPGALSLLGGVEMLVTAELGRTRMAVRDLLGLTPGMVVEIDRAAGSPIDLLVNGRRIATGEVVVIDEEFGIRITEIAPVMEPSR